jgi:hypothetical protein
MNLDRRWFQINTRLRGAMQAISRDGDEMTSIRRIFFAMLTRSSSNAETDSAINLVITQQGSDVVNHR